MSRLIRRLMPIVVALGFLAVTVGIGFFHTEDSVPGKRDCPACQFQSSSLSIAPAALVLLPPLVCRGLIPDAEPLQEGGTIIRPGSSRAPPAV